MYIFTSHGAKENFERTSGKNIRQMRLDFNLKVAQAIVETHNFNNGRPKQ
jgi:hypothetical protein